MDHTINIGTKKALAILSVPTDIMKNGKALVLSDIKVILIDVKDKWNGDIVKQVLRKLFFSIGFPSQIIRDCGSDLKKGIAEILCNVKSPFAVTSDITHFIGNMLKRKYSKDKIFIEIRCKIITIRKQLLQTSLSFLIPPRERLKSKFLNLSEYADWFEKIFTYLNRTSVGTAEGNRVLEVFGWMLDNKQWFFSFCYEMYLLEEIQALIKNNGISLAITAELSSLLLKLDDQCLRDQLIAYVEKELELSTTTGTPTMATSDIIESLFGKYKYLTGDVCSEINRSVLMLPCIGVNITPEMIKEAFEDTSNKDVNNWSKTNIGKTALSKRKEAFKMPKKANKTLHKNGQKSANTPLVEDVLITDVYVPSTA